MPFEPHAQFRCTGAILHSTNQRLVVSAMDQSLTPWVGIVWLHVLFCPTGGGQLKTVLLKYGSLGNILKALPYLPCTLRPLVVCPHRNNPNKYPESGFASKLHKRQRFVDLPRVASLTLGPCSNFDLYRSSFCCIVYTITVLAEL